MPAAIRPEKHRSRACLTLIAAIARFARGRLSRFITSQTCSAREFVSVFEFVFEGGSRARVAGYVSGPLRL